MAEGWRRMKAKKEEVKAYFYLPCLRVFISPTSFPFTRQL